MSENHVTLLGTKGGPAIRPGSSMPTANLLVLNGIAVSAIRTKHPPLKDCFALSFNTQDTHVVFSGDTAPIAELEELARGADLLIHEAMLERALPALLDRVGKRPLMGYGTAR